MRPRPRFLLAAASAALLCVSAPSAAQDGSGLVVTLARVQFGVHRTSAAPRHALRIKATFPSLDALQTFDPTVDALEVTVAGVSVLSVAPSPDAKGFRFFPRRGGVRRWRYRARGEAGSDGLRLFSANPRTGRIRLTVKRADLGLIHAAGPDDVTVAVTIGATTAEQTLSIPVVRPAGPERWVYRFVPDPPPPDGPLAFTSLVSSSLPNTARPHVETARTQEELTTLWTALGSPGPLPQVDFTRDMVVAVSSLVHGPGAFPPILDVVAVRGRSGSGNGNAAAAPAIEIDWRLALCEENVCPGAPVPCPTATPFHVFKTRRHTGTLRTAQQPTIGVCP